MKKITILALVCLILLTLMPLSVSANEGYCGYEGGISSGEVAGKTSYEYQEVNFLTGKPVVLKGTLTIKKSMKGEKISSTYTYDLKNTDTSSTLKRTLIYSTMITKKDNGQIVEETSLTGKPVETMKIGNESYTLGSIEFSRTNLTDVKSAVNYYAGNFSGRKIYKTGDSTGGTSSTTGSLTVDITGKFYGYDQYWGTTEVEEIKYVIQSEKKKDDKLQKWGGTADVTLSTSTTKQMEYIKNKPNEISFEGGYVEKQLNSSILEYSAKLPAFDVNGAPTDNIITTNDSLKIETFPVQTRLKVPNLSHLKGHWSENDIKMLYSLEVLYGNDSLFNPEQFMSRAEFAKAVLQAAREVPSDSALSSKTAKAKTTTSKNKDEIQTFVDVSKDHLWYNQIETAYKRGLLNGKGENRFKPDEYLTISEVLTVFVRALGLEKMAPSNGATTSFKDNDQIPAYARNAVSVSEQIGLIVGDDKGYLKPNDKLSNARAATLLNRFISYMRDGIRKDYREKYFGF